MWILLLLLIIILLYWYEGFRSCSGCSGAVDRAGTPILNPYSWPYSGTQCVDDIYIGSKDSNINYEFKPPAPVHLSTPDHVELV